MKRERLWWETPGWIALAVTVIVLLQAQGSAQAPVAVAGENSLERSGIEDSQAIPFTLQDGYLIVMEGWIGAHRHLRLLLDTGVRTILLYRDRLGNRLPELRVEQQIRGASLGGAASLEVVTLPRVQLNGTNLERRAVLLQNSPAGVLPGVDGYLSLTSLGA